MNENKQVHVTDAYVSEYRHRFDEWIDKDAFVIDEEALNSEYPKEYPSLPEDPVERKKVFTEYNRRLYGATITAFKRALARNKEAREKASIRSTMMAAAAAGSDELKNDYNLGSSSSLAPL